MTEQNFLVSYVANVGPGRAFAFLNREGSPRKSDIRAWEREIGDQFGHTKVAIISFQLLENEPDE